MPRRPKVRLQVFHFLCEYKAQNDGLNPSYQEISKHFGWKNPMNAWYHIAGLERDGLLTFDKQRRFIINGEYYPPNL